VVDFGKFDVAAARWLDDAGFTGFRMIGAHGAASIHTSILWLTDNR
jgi:hypothetical protein